MKILVIRFNFIGDVLLSSVLCRSLKESIDGSEVHYLMYSPSAPLFEGCDYVDRVISITPQERANPIKYLKRLFQLRKERYDIILDASSTAKSELISMFCSNAKYRVGRKKKKRGYFYTHLRGDLSASKNKIEQRLDLLSPLINDGLQIKYCHTMKLSVEEQQKARMRENLSAMGVDLSRPLIAFVGGAREPEKKWKFEYLLETALYCIETLGAQLLLFAGLPEEKLDAQRLSERLDDPSNVFVGLELESLKEVPVLFSVCDLFVGNEGGPRHIAEAVATPTACVFSPHADKDEWFVSSDKKHQAIEWRDVPQNCDVNKEDFKVGDALYYQVYHNIQPKHFIPIVQDVAEIAFSQRSLNEQHSY